VRHFILDRIGSKEFGTLGILYEELEPGHIVETSVTLEPQIPIIPAGKTYKCATYKGDSRDYVVYQILNVPGHTYVEIHPGNWAKDTKGCILLGEWFGVVQGVLGINQSKHEFNEFMSSLKGEPFELEVV
jgi:hypothetical protein